MSAFAFLAFVLGVPLAMALGGRFTHARHAFAAVGILSLVTGFTTAILLSVDAAWLSLGTIVTVWVIATTAPLALGMAAWRTPDLISPLQASFNALVEPYLGRPVSLLGWAHLLFNKAPAHLVGTDPAAQNADKTPQ